MADNVSVTFSAQIGQLISGVDQVKDAIGSIAAPVNSIASVLSGFGETFAAAFGVSAVASFVAQMEDLGTQTVRMAAMLGVSTAQAQQLGFIAKATGGDTESLALSMERLQVNLQKAQSGAGPAAQALQALGLSAKSLIGLPLEEQLNRIADAVSKFADGGNKTAIVMDLFGRNGAQMIPILDKGRAGFEELRDGALAAGIVMSKETVDGLDRAGTAAVTLGASITGLGEAIVGRFSKQLIEAADSLTTFTADLSALVQTGHLGEVMLAELGSGARMAAANFASIGKVFLDLISLNGNLWARVPADWQAGNDEILRIQKETDDKILLQAAKLRLAIGMNLKFGGGAPTDKPQAPPMEVPNKDALSAQMEIYQSQIKEADEAYRQIGEKLSAEVKLHQISYDQETQELLAALASRRDAEEAAIDGELALYARGTAGYEKALAERRQLEAKYGAAHQQILDQQLEHDTQEWHKALQPLESAFNSQLRGLLSGTETWGQAMKKIFGDVVIAGIEEVEKLVFTWIEGEAAKTTATITGNAVRAGADEAGTVASMGSKIAEATASIGIDVGEVFANLAAWLTSTLGPAGVPVALGLSAGVGAVALSQIKHLDVGGFVVSPGLAMLHANETVVPAQVNTPYAGAGAGAGAGGDTHVYFNVSAIDSNSVQKFFQQNGTRIAQVISAKQTTNPSLTW
jgi:hypothetical protein